MCMRVCMSKYVQLFKIVNILFIFKVWFCSLKVCVCVCVPIVAHAFVCVCKRARACICAYVCANSFNCLKLFIVFFNCFVPSFFFKFEFMVKKLVCVCAHWYARMRTNYGWRVWLYVRVCVCKHPLQVYLIYKLQIIFNFLFSWRENPQESLSPCLTFFIFLVDLSHMYVTSASTLHYVSCNKNLFTFRIYFCVRIFLARDSVRIFSFLFSLFIQWPTFPFKLLFLTGKTFFLMISELSWRKLLFIKF